MPRYGGQRKEQSAKSEGELLAVWESFVAGREKGGAEK
jgi:hypothetical protein